jgi:undecaprenyl-diphosphatase
MFSAANYYQIITMNIFDSSIIALVNSIAHQSELVDRSIAYIGSFAPLKGGLPAAMLWWAWFKNETNAATNRKHVLATLAASVVALAIAQILEGVLPFRPLPLLNPELAFTLPYGVDIPDKGSWSSFPSDHAVLFFSLAAGFFFISKAMGIFALVFCFFMIFLARVYLGHHYPSDVIAGAALGMGLTWAFNKSAFILRMADRAQVVFNSYPKWFYTAFFLFTYQLSEVFHDLRNLVKGLIKFLKLLTA